MVGKVRWSTIAAHTAGRGRPLGWTLRARRAIGDSVVNATSCQLLWWGSQSVTGFLLGVLADGFVLAVYENSQQILASASWVILVMFESVRCDKIGTAVRD